MKLVVQRVARSSVTVEGREISRIGRGLMVLFGVEKGDVQDRADALAEKLVHLRIFEDENGKMNRSCLDVGGEILVVSQFTLAGDCSRGRRPGFDKAAPPQLAEEIYQGFKSKLANLGVPVCGGQFGANMQVDLVNDGPVTFILE